MKSILITGGTQGIGYGIAQKFCAEGYHAFLSYKSNNKNAETAVINLEKAGFSASSHRADVRSPDDMKQLFEEIEQSGNQLEVVTVNAADEIPKPIDEATFEEWHDILLTKLDGAFLTTKFAIPLLKKSNNPSIIYITSEDGVRPSGEYIAYQVGTAGLIAMANANANYLTLKYGIRVNAVSPGAVKTGLYEKAGQSDEMWDNFDKQTPIGRIATVEDVANAAWYLASDQNKFINGATINVDGGYRWKQT